jgi:hypothetical protein
MLMKPSERLKALYDLQCASNKHRGLWQLSEVCRRGLRSVDRFVDRCLSIFDPTITGHSNRQG